MNEDPNYDELERLRAENAQLRDLCRHILPVFEAARPLVLTLERLRDAAREPQP